MNALALASSTVATMTSKEMADLTEKRHDSVKRTIETLAAKGTISQPQIVDGDKSANGVVEKLYLIGKRDSYVIVAQLSPEFTARLVDRWQELEAGASPALNLRQPAQMLAVAMQLAELVQEQQTQLTAQAPKVAFAEAVGDASNTQTISEVAKALGVGPRKFFDFLRATSVLMTNNLPFQQHIDAGRFRVIETTYRDNDGEDRIKLQTRVTGKGVTFLQQRLSKSREERHAHAT
ncbi:MAG: phage antirepressor KilAC domain-containing protein [Rhodoferax sp.]